MTDLFPVERLSDAQCVDSRLIAQDLGLKHPSFFRTIVKYKNDLEERFSLLRFEIEAVKSNRGVKHQKYALLTEGQAIAAATLCRNTEKVVAVKFKLTQSFLSAKALLAQSPAPIPSQLDLAKQVVQLLELEAANKSKVAYYDQVLDSASAFTITSIAQELGLSARALNKRLKEVGIQHKVDGQWVLTAKYLGLDYVQTTTVTFEGKSGKVYTRHTTKWTEKGRAFILSLFKIGTNEN